MLNRIPYLWLAALAVTGLICYSNGHASGLKSAPEYVAAETERARLEAEEDAARAKRESDAEAASMADVGVKDPYLLCNKFVEDVEVWADWKLREEEMNREYYGPDQATGRY